MIHCDAITPDGREVHFDDIIKTGDIVVDERTGEPYLVGLDRGDKDPLLHPIGADEWNAYCFEQMRVRDEQWRNLFPTSQEVERNGD